MRRLASVTGKFASGEWAGLARARCFDAARRSLVVSSVRLDASESRVKIAKIPVSNPVVELGGDAGIRSVWQMVKDKLIMPYVAVPIQYFDLALESRIQSNDQVTIDAAAAIKKCGAGIKCSTVDITAEMVKERQLKRMWKSAVVFDRERSLRSATSTLRALMEGANFRTPIILKSIPKAVPGWQKPIVIARHVYADQYRATDIRIQKDSKMQLLITPGDGAAPKTYDIHSYAGGDGVALAMYNEVEKIRGFAHACFRYALDTKFPLYLGTKENLLKDYDGVFVKVFDETYEQYSEAFDAAGIWYQSTNIDRMIAFTMRSEGGFVLACKNYDGAMLSEMVSTGFGSAELMNSVVASADGKTMLTESFYPGTARGVHSDRPEINPLSCIFAWIRGLQHRAKLDGNFELKTFADTLESASLETVEAGKITRDLVLVGGSGARDEFLSSEELVDAISQTLQDRLIRGAKIIYTLTDEAPMLATYAFLPVVRAFTKKHGIDIELKDISLAGRVIAAFSDKLPAEKVQADELAQLGELATKPHANIVKLPNISASLPQLSACIQELQEHGYPIPDYPAEPKNAEEKEIRDKYSKVLGSAVNPVLREGNSDRRAADAVKQYAKKHPHSMGKWTPESKTHVAHMNAGDFYESEKSMVVTSACDARIELVANDGTVTVLKAKVPLIPGEVIDGAFMSKRHLRQFYKREIEDAKDKELLLSLHLKATMMKVSDPVMFGHMVEVFFEDVFEKHAQVLEEIGAEPNNGFGDVEAKIAKLPRAKRQAIEQDINATYEKRPMLAMVDSDKGITNLHVPSDVIIDASMPAMLRSSGQMWTADNTLADTKALIPDRCYAGIYHEVIEDCKKNGAFDPSTMGSVPNVGLMAQKAEEYGSHDKTFIIKKDGRVRVVAEDGTVFMEHAVEEGDIWRMCQTKDIPIQDWVKLAVTRARSSGSKAVFWLDECRGHDAVMINKVKQYLSKHDTSGLDIEIMSPSEACRVSCERARKGLDTISVTGNVLRDYNTDLFPIIELGTSAKMLSIVPMIAGGGMYETGAGGSAPKHVQQLLKENHLRWDSLGEYLALAVSLEDLATKTKNIKTRILADCLNQSTSKFLDANKNPGRKKGQLDNRGSHFYLALYWAQALAAQNLDMELQSQFARVAKELEASETIIIGDLTKCQGQSVDIGGYFHPDPKKVEAVMRPSDVFNAILTLGANW